MTPNTSALRGNDTAPSPRSGYDLPVYGLKDGQFLRLHIPALVCIQISFVCACAIIIASFRMKNFRTFFSWSKGERLVVYLALCDLLFNVAHTMDHAHYVATRSHIHPEQLCEFYGFMLAQFISAQNLMVNVVAVNAFALIYFKIQMDFGQRDWRLLVYTFGLPFVGAVIAGSLRQFGTNGAFCYFDAIRGHLANIFFTTVPLMLVMVINAVLYLLTWRKIKVEAAALRQTLGEAASGVRASHEAAKTMMLFVAAFFVQWWAMALYGAWQLVDHSPPQLLFQFVTSFSNLGGVINFFVYMLIRRRLILARHKKPTSQDNRQCTVDDSGRGPSFSETRSLDDWSSTRNFAVSMNANGGEQV